MTDEKKLLMNDVKPQNLPYEDFAKLDIRAGTILSGEEVPKSKKLLKLQVDFGPEIGVRTVMAGIRGSYHAHAISGLRCVAVLNIAPITLMGVESSAMVLATHNNEGLELLLHPGVVPDGSEVA